MPSDWENKVVFETAVAVTGWEFILATRGQNRKLRITDSEILIEDLPSIPIVSITNCRIRFTNLQLEFVDKDSATTKLMIRAPLKYHFGAFPANYIQEREFVEDLYDEITDAILDKGALWSPPKDAKKDLNNKKIIEIKRRYADQRKRKRIFSILLLLLIYLWLLFLVATKILDIISLDEYDTFVTLVLFSIFPIMFAFILVNINRCPYCKAFFISISTASFCRKCRVPLVDR